MHFAFYIFIFLPFRGACADWGWYAGDVCVRPDSGQTLPERVREGIAGGFDWVVAFYPIQAGAFRGLSDVTAFYEADDRRIIPLLGVSGEAGKGVWGEGIAFGVDPRSPVPSDSLQAAIDWADSHQGVFVFSHAEGRLASLCDRWQGGTAFIGLRDAGWSKDCDVGGAWDQLLKQGRRIFIVGTNDPRPLREGSKTYVWAKGMGAGEIVEGLRRGAVYVSERDGIRMDLRVNGAGMGAVVPAEGYVNVRVFATARHPISRVALVSDGRVVWEASPDSILVEERLRLPVGDDATYLRPIVESRTGGYRALGNPVFLRAENADGEAEEQSPEAGTTETLYASMSGALETALVLAPGPRLALLSALLREVKTRAVVVRVLQSRPDLISDEVLEDLLDDRDREVRLGAAYVCVARGGEGLSENLLGLLLDREAAVRDYAARMISQSHTPIPAESLLPFLTDRDALVRLCLTEAVDTRSDDPNVADRLVEMLTDPDAGVSDAAARKLVEMGARSFQAVTLLLQALRSGHGKAADLIARIGDHRILPALEEVYRTTPYGDLKRRCFLALDRLGAPYPDRKRVVVRRASAPPAIDGVPSPGEWDGATPLDGLGFDRDGTPEGNAFAARMTCDEQTIYILLSRPATKMDDGIRRLAGHDDPTVLKEDRLELSFDPTGDGKGRRTFVVSAGGAQLEARNGDISWNAAWKAAVGRSGKVWNAECAIPFSSLDLRPSGHGRPVGFNLSWVETLSRTSWSITYGAPDNPGRFGELVFAE